ncbi:MAG: 1,4-alpha-glucan branching protein GlgB [Lachnospiraceae bacterium]|nr:1,4-alpha-glucan branching protein GlgB [Lachnospiraceae bacterium]
MGQTKNQREEIFISEYDEYLFTQGNHYEIYKKMGAHKAVVDGVEGVHFAVWAPNAQYVNVAGTFNDWDIYRHNMNRLRISGIFETFIPGVTEDAIYKYVITTNDGRKIYKADPYGYHSQMRPENASIVKDISNFKWTDSAWQNEKAKKDYNKEPMAIYECHIGSWKKHPADREEKSFYNYRLFADEIVSYLKEMKYTHVELIGIAEYPFDGSWGYQVTGYYAPTSRYGTPEDFQYLVNTLHKNKIGVILDWVPAHFPRDAFGLSEFDGTCLYEHPDKRKGEHPEWGTKIFNYEKPEVRNFLIANAVYWVQEYHIDALRVDAVASMLYLDYGKKEGQWVANQYGDNKNLDAIGFLRHLNSLITGRYPGTLMIAEESTAWPKVTAHPDDDGLGFSFKWNMGWMHDFCEYLKLDPIMKRGSHYNMTFAMSYHTAENYILPISHDEVVHLKCSMLNKMPGYRVDKFANLRVAYSYMFTHSGKKLLFMGQDFGQECEWSEARELEWNCLSDPLHSGMNYYVKKLLELYNKYPCLYEIDNGWEGFEWMEADDADRSVYAYVRKSSKGTNNILTVLNFTPMERKDYRIGVPKKKKYKLLLNSDAKEFGGNGAEIPAEISAEKILSNGKEYSIGFDLPAYGAVHFLF